MSAALAPEYDLQVHQAVPGGACWLAARALFWAAVVWIWLTREWASIQAAAHAASGVSLLACPAEAPRPWPVACQHTCELARLLHVKPGCDKPQSADIVHA